MLAEIREQVRRRANCACEFCGVRETDIGNQLTIDHFQPKTKGGTDALDNLIYCCMSCNQYKLDYWHEQPNDPILWNPRTEAFAEHFLQLEDGTLHPLTATGRFTINRLRLNRPPLVAYRLKQAKRAEQTRLLAQYRDLVQMLELVNRQLEWLLKEQQKLLDEQRKLLTLFLRQK